MSRPRKYERAKYLHPDGAADAGYTCTEGSCGPNHERAPAVALLYRTGDGNTYRGDAACAKHVPKHLRPARSARSRAVRPA